MPRLRLARLPSCHSICRFQSKISTIPKRFNKAEIVRKIFNKKPLYCVARYWHCGVRKHVANFHFIKIVYGRKTRMEKKFRGDQNSDVRQIIKEFLPYMHREVCTMRAILSRVVFVKGNDQLGWVKSRTDLTSSVVVWSSVSYYLFPGSRGGFIDFVGLEITNLKMQLKIWRSEIYPQNH